MIKFTFNLSLNNDWTHVTIKYQIFEAGLNMLNKNMGTLVTTLMEKHFLVEKCVLKAI